MLVRSKIEAIRDDEDHQDHSSTPDFWSNVLDPYPSSPDRFGEDDSFDSSISRIIQPKSLYKEWEVADFYDLTQLEEQSLCASPLLFEDDSCGIPTSKKDFPLSCEAELAHEQHIHNRMDTLALSRHHSCAAMYLTTTSSLPSSEGSTPCTFTADYPQQLTVIAESDDDTLLRHHMDLLFDFAKSPHERHDTTSMCQQRQHRQSHYYTTRSRLEDIEIVSPSGSCAFRQSVGVTMNHPILRGPLEHSHLRALPAVCQAKHGARLLESFAALNSEDSARQRYLPWLRNVNIRRGGSLFVSRSAAMPSETEEPVTTDSSGQRTTKIPVPRDEGLHAEVTERAPHTQSCPPESTDDSEYADDDAEAYESDEWSTAKSSKRKKHDTRSTSSGTKRSKCTDDSTTGS